ncbi:unnamed protein product [Staurois parvus]|uniref:Uncharacterized protein n=1 Tax=Staurois parvus TaxID=386267 RepID=A0ABN9G8N0_9NEOB|nr:unnamed protein product [Staurois parvus]
MGPRAIGDHGALVSSPTLKPHPQKPMKGTRGISWGPLLTPGPWAVPEFPNGQSAPVLDFCFLDLLIHIIFCFCISFYVFVCLYYSRNIVCIECM